MTENGPYEARTPSQWDCDERGHVPTLDGCLGCGASPHYGLPCCGHRLVQHTDDPHGYGNTDRCRCCRKSKAGTPANDRERAV